MSKTTADYEQKRQRIVARRTEEDYLLADALIDKEMEDLSNKSRVGYMDVAKIGTGVLVGGGIGLLAGVATIAVAASAAEIVVGGVITKVAGVVGGAAGLGWGLKTVDEKKSN